MLKAAGSDPGDWDGTYIKFRNCGPRPGNKTCDFEVSTDRGDVLGIVKWFGRWRKYSFFPEAGTLYEETCLREIAEFCQDRTRDQKRGI